MTILFPSSYFNKNRVDEDLQAEYNAVVNTGKFNTIFFGYDEWFDKGQITLTEIPQNKINAVYRGWMMKPLQYREFYDTLLEHNIELVTDPDAYRLMHEFPNIYGEIEEDTAKMVLYPLHSEIDVEQIKKKFGKFMIKDYVKSVKGTDFPKYFDAGITQDEFNRWMDVFYQYRGDLLTGGICVKEYLNLKHYGEKTNEYRVFYIGNHVATVSRNSGQGNYTPTPPTFLIEKYKELPSPFYTIDYAELEEGTWKILEAGDGSVSGLSENQDYETFFRTLAHLQ